MKLSCEIIQDLLPLVHDGICSEESKKVVLEHLAECAQCREISDGISNFCETDLVAEDAAQAHLFRKGFRKIRRRWILSVIAVVMIFPVILLGVGIGNERKGEGVCFSNLDELGACREYLKALENEDYQAAAQCIDFSQYFDEVEEALALRPSDYMVSFEPIQIGDESFMANGNVLQNYLFEEDFWSAALRACEPQAPIPIKIWEQIAPEQSVQNGICYLPYETKWGTFMLVDTMFEMISEQREPELYDFFAIMPKDMYEELLPQMQTRAQEYYEGTQQRLSEVKGMTDDTFAAYMRTYYAEKLQSDLRVESFDYCDAYEIHGQWNIRYEAEIAYNAHSYRTTFEFYAKDGKILHVDARNSERNEPMMQLFETFTPRLR